MAINSTQVSSTGTVTTTLSGQQYGKGKVPSEDIPVVDPETNRDRQNADANTKTNNQAYRDQTDKPQTYNTTRAQAAWDADQRVRLLVPPMYLEDKCEGPKISQQSQMGVLKMNGGIVFPYTPTIEINHSAEYSSKNPTHSNFTQYFYSYSKTSEITIDAVFTVQNQHEAEILIAILHLGRILTKMPFGSDQFAGSPPPVCRLMGYGQYMLNNVPVAVTKFSMGHPKDVDYITVYKNSLYGTTSVPVKTDIKFTLIPLFSKNQMLNATVRGWIDGTQRLDGIL